MGQDHPISWCKLYDGDSVADGTGDAEGVQRRPRLADRHGPLRHRLHGQQRDREAHRRRHPLGRRRGPASPTAPAPSGRTSRARRSSTTSTARSASTSPRRQGLLDRDRPGPGLPVRGLPEDARPDRARPNNKTTVATIPTRADHGNSEDGVLGMTLENGFDLSDPAKRDVFIYYSPRNPAWPTTGNQVVVGYNQISRFTLNAAGTAVVPDSERVILHVPKAKISGNPAGFPGGPANNGPGHVGGAGLDFDSDGDLYLGVGDDVSPNAAGPRPLPADGLPRARSAGTPARRRRTRPTCAARSSASIRSTTIAVGAEPGVGRHVLDPGGQHVPGRDRQGAARDLRDGLPPAVHGAGGPGEPGHRRRRRVLPRQRANNATARPPASASGTSSTGPASWAGRSAWATTRRRTPRSAGTTRPTPPPTCSTTARSRTCRPTSSGARRRDDAGRARRRSTASTRCPARRSPRPCGRSTPARPAASRRPTSATSAPAACRRSPARSTATTRTRPAPAPSRRTTTVSWFITNRGDSRRLLEGGPAPRGQQQDAAGQRLGAGRPGRLADQRTRSSRAASARTARSTWRAGTTGCCRNELGTNSATQLVKIEFNVQDECLTDTLPPNTNHAIAGRAHPTEEDTYLEEATFTVTAGDAGCAGLEGIEVRVNSDDDADWEPYDAPLELDARRVHDRLPRDRREGQRVGRQVGDVRGRRGQRHRQADGRGRASEARRTRAASTRRRRR